MPIVVEPEIADVMTSALFRPGELEKWWIDDRGPGIWPEPAGSCWLHALVGGERFDHFLVQPGVKESAAERAERLSSDLEDWIAESRFGWGQQRSP